MSRRGRWMAGACVGTAAVVLLATGGAPAPAPHQGPGGGAGKGIAVGAYLHYGSPGVDRMRGLSRWLGGTDLRAGHTYLPGDTWANIEGLPNSLDAWARWRKQRSDRLFVLNVPMLDQNEAGVPDDRIAELLRSGAEGAYDHHFRRLAERLVSLGLRDTVIVLGWEMNGFNYTHRCRPEPEAWKQYWRNIVSAMRSVEGQRFRFDFAPNRGIDAIAWTECYPGDDVVDIIGMDSYDQPPGNTFHEQITQPYGLQHQVDFAREHGKRISYPEWGLFRNGDNPDYMRRMLTWIAKQKPLYHSISDYCPHGVWQCGKNPRSSRVFREFLSAGRRPAAGPPHPGALPGTAVGAGEGSRGRTGGEAAGSGAVRGDAGGFGQSPALLPREPLGALPRGEVRLFPRDVPPRPGSRPGEGPHR
ncbi:glycoside hydrolase family 26 protein [Streptomyces sp. NPDC012794]|uniref:glycoside hydrolase family 26 protein n=1 Tax=Streptomyces sp. NPDC012794 TaxID=3364850 RepID=UPI00368C09A1